MPVGEREKEMKAGSEKQKEKKGWRSTRHGENRNSTPSEGVEKNETKTLTARGQRRLPAVPFVRGVDDPSGESLSRVRLRGRGPGGGGAAGDDGAIGGDRRAMRL